MKKVRIYTKSHCPYCAQVKDYLKDNNIEFENKDMDQDPKFYEELKKATKHKTVPQIFVNDEFIGGAKEFFQWIKKNSLI